MKEKSLDKSPSGGALAPFDYGADKGAGYEGTTRADYAVPFLALLQAGSPQVDRAQGSSEFLPDARAGMLFNTVSKELYDGETGIILQPIATSHRFVEWLPREKGGGFKGEHLPESEIVKKAKERVGNKLGVKLLTEDGNELVETFSMFAAVLPEVDALEEVGLVIVGFTSTKIRPYRQAMYRLHNLVGKPPLFANRIRLVTVPEKNAKGSFYNLDVRPAKPTLRESLLAPKLDDGSPHPLLVRAKAYRAAIESGAVRPAQDTARSSAPAEGGSPEGDADIPF